MFPCFTGKKNSSRTAAKPLVWELTVDGMDQEQIFNWYLLLVLSIEPELL